VLNPSHRRGVAVLVLGCAIVSRADAVVLFDTISTATFVASSYDRVGEYAPFAGETASHDYAVSTRITIEGADSWLLTGLACRISRDGDFLGAGRARLWISEALDGGAPTQDVSLGNLATTITTPTTVGLDALGSLGFVLHGGHSYWISLTSVPGDLDATRLRWYRSSQGAIGTTFTDDVLDPSPWITADGAAPGIKIAGEAVPAPSALALLALGAYRRNRRR
jgi:hypothetical protein